MQYCNDGHNELKEIFKDIPWTEGKEKGKKFAKFVFNKFSEGAICNDDNFAANNYYVGRMYECGYGVGPSVVLAIYHYNLSGFLLDPLIRLHFIYKDGIGGIPPDPFVAQVYLLRIELLQSQNSLPAESSIQRNENNREA